jgi:hypothetical protein
MVEKMLEQLTRWDWCQSGLGVIEARYPITHGFLIISNSSLIRNMRILNMKIHGGQSISYECIYSKAS